MSILQIIMIIVCVLAISIGQLLFKRVGVEIEDLGTVMHKHVILFAFIAFFIYASATLLWIYLLRTLPLSQIYPFMALSFIIVPILSSWFFGEMIVSSYLLGAILIVAGIVVITMSNG